MHTHQVLVAVWLQATTRGLLARRQAQELRGLQRVPEPRTPSHHPHAKLCHMEGLDIIRRVVEIGRAVPTTGSELGIDSGGSWQGGCAVTSRRTLITAVVPQRRTPPGRLRWSSLGQLTGHAALSLCLPLLCATGTGDRLATRSSSSATVPWHRPPRGPLRWSQLTVPCSEGVAAWDAVRLVPSSLVRMRQVLARELDLWRATAILDRFPFESSHMQPMTMEFPWEPGGLQLHVYDLITNACLYKSRLGPKFLSREQLGMQDASDGQQPRVCLHQPPPVQHQGRSPISLAGRTLSLQATGWGPPSYSHRVLRKNNKTSRDAKGLFLGVRFVSSRVIVISWLGCSSRTSCMSRWGVVLEYGKSLLGLGWWYSPLVLGLIRDKGRLLRSKVNLSI
jgi:hypothetical protein